VQFIDPGDGANKRKYKKNGKTFSDMNSGKNEENETRITENVTIKMKFMSFV
jgi:hypothetical protein